MIRDLRTLTPGQDAWRYAAAQRAHDASDVPGFPRLRHWNYDPCPEHREQGITPACLRCGGVLRRHQRVGAMWLWLAMHGLLADPTGTGKTFEVAALLAMLKESGELGEHRPAQRGVIIAGAVEQWRDELRRLVPGLKVAAATGTLAQRQAKYLDPWEVAIVSPETLRLRDIRRRVSGGVTRAGDLAFLEHFDLGLVVFDDVDPMRNHESATAYAVSHLCRSAHRAVGVHATPQQKRVTELWSFLAPLGGLEVLGPLPVFKHTYVRLADVAYTTRDQAGRRVDRVAKKEVGIKNGARLRALVGPLMLRRTLAQMDDVEMPVLQPSTVWLDPSPAQERRYAELKRGVLRMIREEGESVTEAHARELFMRGWQICAGLSNLDSANGDGRPPDSVKLDWVVDRLDGDLADEKVVVFVNFKPNVTDLSTRLGRLGIGHIVRWGNDANRAGRHASLERFRTDPACRVLIGTTSIEKSLNLQCARYLIAVDSIMNPARMEQLAGRIRRVGSAHATVYFIQLLLRHTQEAWIPGILKRESAIKDYIWGETSDLFPSLTPLQLLQLISGDPELARRQG